MKRHEALQPLSREHHNGLLLCWKIRAGISKGVSPDRMFAYAKWFWDTHLVPHFKAEEEYIFPILGENDEMIKRALEEHGRLERLFTSKSYKEESLQKIGKELDEHIRFEERVLFPKIQDVATPEQLKMISDLHQETDFVENKNDEFWK